LAVIAAVFYNADVAAVLVAAGLVFLIL